MPSFAGYDLGPAVQMRTAAQPHQFQYVVFPGVNGVGVNRCGSRGGMTEAYGVCVAETPLALGAVEDQFRLLQADAVEGDLVDTTGATYTRVILVDFRPVDEISPAPGYGYARAYRMEFLHTH